MALSPAHPNKYFYLYIYALAIKGSRLCVLTGSSTSSVANGVPMLMHG